MSREVERRDFLKGLGGAAALGLAGPTLLVPLVGCGPSESLEAALLGFFADLGSAREVGREYLKLAPEEDDRDALVQRLAGAGLRRWEAFAATDPAALLRAVRARHTEDFAAERVVRLRGWMLSETEARLCALAHLAGPRAR
jgi:hypothetical protein